MEKRIFLLGFLALILSWSFISAISLDVSSKPVSDIVITDLKKPAVFELTIRNLEDTDDFEIYSLVGIDIIPEEKFTLESGDTKKIEIQIMPQQLRPQGFFTFEYRIKNSKNEIQSESLTINIVGLGGGFLINSENINPKSENLRLSIENIADMDFNNVEIKMDSAFFEFKTETSMKKEEIKTFDIKIDKEKLKELEAGDYILNAQFKTLGESGRSETIIKFLEQEDIETSETKEGIIISRQEIIKKNLGNTRKKITIISEKNLVSYLFTTLNVAPTRTSIHGFKIDYLWEKELLPDEELKVIIKTNWFYPIIIVIFAGVLFLLIKRYVESDLILRKKVNYIQTRGGEFALKITLKAKAKKFIERINIVDKLPPLVKLYEKYGAIKPDKVDLQNKRMEWNVDLLDKDEERIFTYIIYSKVGVVGKFELPSARAVYEKEGKIKETTSNRSFFINEPKKQKKESEEED